MRILWDESKRASNIAKHGADFAWLTVDFFERSMVIPSRDGRYVAIGVLGENAFAVIFALRGREAIR